MLRKKLNSIKLIILKLAFTFIALKSIFAQNRAFEDGFDLLEDGELYPERRSSERLVFNK